MLFDNPKSLQTDSKAGGWRVVVYTFRYTTASYPPSHLNNGKRQKGLDQMEDLILIIDTREQTPLTFGNIPSERATLHTADYSIRGYESVFGVERKTIGDLVGSLTAGRERFMREMQRLQAYTFKRLLIVGSRSDIEAGRYRSAATPKAILASVATIEARYDIPAVYAIDATEAARMIEGWALYYSREANKRALEGTNTTAEAGANLGDAGGTGGDATNQLATVAGWKDTKLADQLQTVSSWNEASERQCSDGKTRSLPPPRPRKGQTVTS